MRTLAAVTSTILILLIAGCASSSDEGNSKDKQWQPLSPMTGDNSCEGRRCLLSKDSFVAILDYQIQKYALPNSIKKAFIVIPDWKEPLIINGHDGTKIEIQKHQYVASWLSKLYPTFEITSVRSPDETNYLDPYFFKDGKFSDDTIHLRIGKMIISSGGPPYAERIATAVVKGKTIIAKYTLRRIDPDDKIICHPWIVEKEEIIENP